MFEPNLLVQGVKDSNISIENKQISKEQKIQIHRKEQLKILANLFEKEQKIHIEFYFNENLIEIEQIVDLKTGKYLNWNELKSVCCRSSYSSTISVFK